MAGKCEKKLDWSLGDKDEAVRRDTQNQVILFTNCFGFIKYFGTVFLVKKGFT